MGFAPYFAKNASAAQSLLNNIGSDALKAVLEGEVVMLAFDRSGATAEGAVLLDLVIRIVARLYPRLVIHSITDGMARKVKALERQAMAINPNLTVADPVSSATRAIVVGATPLRGSFTSLKFLTYAGSDNWLAAVSQHRPMVSGTSRNPFGAGLAACLATANLFRSVFAKQIGEATLDEEAVYSAWSVEPATPFSPNPPLREFDIGVVHLAGAGAIGNGFLWALSASPARGHLHVLDDEAVDATNIQRYVMCDDRDRRLAKIKVAARAFKDRKSKVQVHGYRQTWESFVEACDDRRFDLVVTALDSAEARIRVQASLPKQVINAWTQQGEAGVSRHRFSDRFACLACLYIPKRKSAHLDELVLQGLNVPRDEAVLREVRRRLQLQVPNDAAFLADLAKRGGHQAELLTPYVGKSVGELYQGAVCSGRLLDFKRGEALAAAEVPMAFQSALAGILLAAELVPGRPSLPTVTQFDLMRKVPDSPSHALRKQGAGKCICEDDDFVEAYLHMYPPQAVA